MPDLTLDEKGMEQWPDTRQLRPGTMISHWVSNVWNNDLTLVHKTKVWNNDLTQDDKDVEQWSDVG